MTAGLTPGDQALLAEAASAAVAWHAGQYRKGTTIPYVSHLFQVAGLVLEHGGSVTAAAAALLHDAVEDTEVSVEDVRSRFGDGVATIVAACTDTAPGDDPGHKRPWEERKAAFLARLGGLDPDTALVVACDKLHNLRTLVADGERHGPDAIAPPRFSVPPDRQLSYHRQVVDRIAGQVPSPLLDELTTLLDRLARSIGPA